MLNPNEPIQRKAPQRQLHTFAVYAEDKPGVLSRITSLFRRRAYNIDSLTAGHTDVPGVSRLTVVLESDDAEARLIEANLYKLVNVLRVEDLTHVATMKRDLALIKVKANADARPQVMQMIEVFRARIIDVAPESLVLEITGTEDKIDGLLEILSPFGIIEMVRTGGVAMTRGSEATTIHPHFVHARVPQDKIS
jgi:acetolactate synthase-1/3 small subunit